LATAPNAVVTLALELYHPPTDTTDSAAVSFTAVTVAVAVAVVAAAPTILPLMMWSQFEE
jgi:hypothetical protein